MKRKAKKRKLTPVGKLLVVILVLLPTVLVCTRCIGSKKAAANTAVSSVSNKKTVKSILNPIFENRDVMSYAEITADTKKLNIKSKNGILIDTVNHKVIAEKHGDTKIYPASMTKVMTLIVAVENIKNLDDTFTVTNEIIDPLIEEEASRAGFDPGEKVTVRDLLYGAILPSGADATIALADYVAGSEREFVELMNKKVNKMGLKNTHFMNSSGLHDEFHYSTPHEMALIMEYAIKNETCKKILSTYQYTTSKTEQHTDGIELYSTMFSRMYGNEAETVSIIAGKTGYTTEGGNCLVSYAENESGGKYVLVTTDATGSYMPIYDAIDAYAENVGNGKTNIIKEQVDNF